jgi:hypothetical protein
LSLNAEGTAMLEIVRDLAPGAELWFAAPVPLTALNFVSAVSFLASNVDVVVSDVGFSHFFPNGQNTLTRAISQVLTSPLNRARAFVQATMNQGDKHYSGLYIDSGISDGLGGKFHLFAANGQTTGPSTPLAANQFTVPPSTDEPSPMW